MIGYHVCMWQLSAWNTLRGVFDFSVFSFKKSPWKISTICLSFWAHLYVGKYHCEYEPDRLHRSYNTVIDVSSARKKSSAWNDLFSLTPHFSMQMEFFCKVPYLISKDILLAHFWTIRIEFGENVENSGWWTKWNPINFHFRRGNLTVKIKLHSISSKMGYTRRPCWDK